MSRRRITRHYGRREFRLQSLRRRSLARATPKGAVPTVRGQYPALAREARKRTPALDAPAPAEQEAKA